MAIKGGGPAPTFTSSGAPSVRAPFTVACWILFPQTTTSPFNPEYFLIPTTKNVGTGGIQSELQLHYVGQSGNPSSYSFGCVIFNNQGGTFDYSPPAEGLPPNVWTHVLFQIDGTGDTVTAAKMYVNGVYQAATGSLTPLNNFFANDPGSYVTLTSGSQAGAAGATVAYPAVWNRLLTPTEITALAAQGDPRVVAAPQLSLFVQLNQATGSVPDLANPSINWVNSGGAFTVVADPFQLPPPPKPPMGTYANPPKLRSYVDHKPHSIADSFTKTGRPWDTYFDHYPVDQSDIFFKPNRQYINSYIDHFARPGDQKLM